MSQDSAACPADPADVVFPQADGHNAAVKKIERPPEAPRAAHVTVVRLAVEAFTSTVFVHD